MFHRNPDPRNHTTSEEGFIDLPQTQKIPRIISYLEQILPFQGPPGVMLRCTQLRNLNANANTKTRP
jgi:hypothetical protein